MARTRRQRAAAAAAASSAGAEAPTHDESDKENVESESDDSDSDDDAGAFTLDGVTYGTYQDMVEAKRARNMEVLVNSGLMGASRMIQDELTAARAQRREASKRGLRPEKRRGDGTYLGPRRKSNRIAGVSASGLYVEDERAGRCIVRGGGGGGDDDDEAAAAAEEEERNFKERVNDGSDLSVRDAVENAEAKWVKDGSADAAELFLGRYLPSAVEEWRRASSSSSPSSPSAAAAAAPAPSAESTPSSSPRSVAKASRSAAGKRGGGGGGGGRADPNGPVRGLSDRVSALRADSDDCVAKVVPERIYSVACHPASSALVVCAGDKWGHVGVWNVDGYGTEARGDGSGEGAAPAARGAAAADGVHLFKPHGRPVTHLEWNASGTRLLSASYDGSVRSFDLEKQTFEEVFATYDDSAKFKGRPGYGLDGGRNYWVQYACSDHRFDGGGGGCLFLSTSVGTVVHVDLRQKGKITSHEKLSERKINTVSLHPDGNVLAAAGLDSTVKLFDVRTFGGPSSGRRSASSAPSTPSTKSRPIATQSAGKSVSSAFFSPSGRSILSTTMANNIDITADFHLSSGATNPTTRIRHNNTTGRWISTFMARWHPGLWGDDELFVVGSMSQPRVVEVFEGTGGRLLAELGGEALTAVASRCCFHPSAERLVLVGGNSSGRVTVVR